MSFDFSSNNEWLQNTSGSIAIPTTAGTIAFWWKPTTFNVADGLERVLFYIPTSTNPPGFFIGFNGASPNRFEGGWYSGVGGAQNNPNPPGIAVTSSTFTNAFIPNNWNLIVATWNSSSSSLYLNGQLMQAYTDSPHASSTASAGNLLNIGGLSGIDSAGGQMGMIALWNAALSGGDLANLAAGYNPNIIETGERAFYWPLAYNANQVTADLNEYWSGSNYSLVNTLATIAADPPAIIAYTSQLSGLNNTAAGSGLNPGTGLGDLGYIAGGTALDDSAAINTMIADINSGGGGEIVWDTANDFMDSLIMQSNVSIVGSPSIPLHFRYNGANNTHWAGGVDNPCIRNLNWRKGLPTRLETVSGVKLPLGILTGSGIIGSNSSQQLILGTGQGTIIDPYGTTLTGLLGTGSQGLYLTIHDPAGVIADEIVLVTAASTDTLTVTRAQKGTTASASWTATTWGNAGSYVSGPTITETILDANISISNINMNCQGQSFTAPKNAAIMQSYGSYPPGEGYWCHGMWFMGINGLKIHNITMIDAAEFYHFSSNIVGEACTNFTKYFVNYKNTTGSTNDDGFHINGPINGCVVNGFTGTGWDNQFALNWGEQAADPSDGLTYPFSSAGDVTAFYGTNVKATQAATAIYSVISVVGSHNTTGTVIIDGLTLNAPAPLFSDITYADFGDVSNVGFLTLNNIIGTANANATGNGLIQVQGNYGGIAIANLDVINNTDYSAMPLLAAYSGILPVVTLSNITWLSTGAHVTLSGITGTTVIADDSAPAIIDNAWSFGSGGGGGGISISPFLSK